MKKEGIQTRNRKLSSKSKKKKAGSCLGLGGVMGDMIKASGHLDLDNKPFHSGFGSPMGKFRPSWWSINLHELFFLSLRKIKINNRRTNFDWGCNNSARLKVEKTNWKIKFLNQYGKSNWKINILISTRKIKKKIELRKSVEINLIVFFFLSVICKQARPSIITRCIRRCSTTCTTRESAWPVVFIRDSPRPRHLRSTLTRTPIRTRTTWRASRVCNWPPRRTPWWVVSHNYSRIEGCSKKKKKIFLLN